MYSDGATVSFADICADPDVSMHRKKLLHVQLVDVRLPSRLPADILAIVGSGKGFFETSSQFVSGEIKQDPLRLVNCKVVGTQHVKRVNTGALKSAHRRLMNTLCTACGSSTGFPAETHPELGRLTMELESSLDPAKRDTIMEKILALRGDTACNCPCGLVQYCSVECQKRDWISGGHKAVHKAVQKCQGVTKNDMTEAATAEMKI